MKCSNVPCGRSANSRLSTPFQKYAQVFRPNRSLAVAALFRAARVSKRFDGTQLDSRNRVFTSAAAQSTNKAGRLLVTQTNFFSLLPAPFSGTDISEII